MPSSSSTPDHLLRIHPDPTLDLTVDSPPPPPPPPVKRPAYSHKKAASTKKRKRGTAPDEPLRHSEKPQLSVPVLPDPVSQPDPLLSPPGFSQPGGEQPLEMQRLRRRLHRHVRLQHSSGQRSSQMKLWNPDSRLLQDTFRHPYIYILKNSIYKC